MYTLTMLRNLATFSWLGKRRGIAKVLIVFVITTAALSLLALQEAGHAPGTPFHVNSDAAWRTQSPAHENPIRPPKQKAAGSSHVSTAKYKDIHVVMPATQSNVHFCKTLLTMTILGYPAPHIVAWGDDDQSNSLLGGGSHFAKITRTLDYINDEARRNETGFDNQLLVMIDSYDIWFQLPLDILLSRYRRIVQEENRRVAHRMGDAYEKEGIYTDVIFGGGKRCSPNQIHTRACYTVPVSPLPKDLYGANTDTINGRVTWSSIRTRYLNSGFMIGPIGKMRPLLERAAVKLEECKDRERAPFDSGSESTKYCYHGSDQSIFVDMFGEQEFYREVMRRHHRSWTDRMLENILPGRPGARPPVTDISGVPIDDMLNPSVTHEVSDETYLPGKHFEFGIGIDYWSELGHQTSNAEADARYIKHNEPLEPQIGHQGMFECVPKATLPTDLLRGATPEVPGQEEPNKWEDVALYSEVCVDKVPVMIHHNSVDKSQRERQWDKTWWFPQARKLMKAQEEEGTSEILESGVTTDKGDVLTWDDLCPIEVEPELFRDVQGQ